MMAGPGRAGEGSLQAFPTSGMGRAVQSHQERRQWGAGAVCGQDMADGVDDFLGAW